MKLIYKALAVAASMFALSSCVEEAIEPLTGQHQEPGLYTMTQLLSQETSEVAGNKLFIVEVASEGVTGKEGAYKGTGNALVLKFVGEGYKLGSNTYTAPSNDEVQPGTYLVGEGGSTYYTVKDGKAEGVLLNNGGIKVSEGEDGYTIEGTVWLANGEAMRISSKAKLVYEKVCTELTQVFNAASNVANGTNSVTLSLASAGLTSEFDAATYSTVIKGTGNYLGIDIYSEDGFVHPGVYKPSAKGGEIKAGEYGIGWDPGDIFNIGMEFFNWGTCWFSVVDGATSAAHINKGEIVVELDAEGIYTITVDNGDIYAVFKGAIPAVTPIPEGQYKMETAFAAINNQPYERNTVTVKMAEKGLTATANKSGVYSFAGTGHYVSVELYSADGTLVPGTYKAAAKAAEGTFVTGSVQDNGNGLVNGSFFSTVTDGKEAGNVEVINAGEVTVAENAGVYTITVAFNGKICTYEGPVTVVTPVIKDPATVVSYTEYTMEEKVEDVYDMTGTPVAGVKKHTVTLTKGDDVVAIFELLANAESDIAGTYTCQEYASAAGLMGNGYSYPDWGVEGGSRYWVNGELVLINAGETLTVTKVSNGLYAFAGSTGYSFVGYSL